MKELKLESLTIRMNYIREIAPRAYTSYSRAEETYIYLALEEGRTWEEIAKVLQRSTSAVRSKILNDNGVLA